MKAQSDTRKCLLLHRWSAPAWQSHYLYQQWFTKLTGCEFDDIVGRKCRFLQGEKTSPTDEKRISDALKSEEECSVNLLNYEKDGTEFVDEVRLLWSNLNWDTIRFVFHKISQLFAQNTTHAHSSTWHNWEHQIKNWLTSLEFKLLFRVKVLVRCPRIQVGFTHWEIMFKGSWI